MNTEKDEEFERIAWENKRRKMAVEEDDDTQVYTSESADVYAYRCGYEAGAMPRHAKKGEENMTEKEIHNIYLHMSGKAEGIAEATGSADFPVLFANAILEYTKRPWQGLTDDEIKEIIGPCVLTPIKGYTRKLFDQIEAKLKEKNS